MFLAVFNAKQVAIGTKMTLENFQTDKEWIDQDFAIITCCIHRGDCLMVIIDHKSSDTNFFFC